MRKIVLYGEFGRRFGKYWHLDVKTPAEAVRAIAANRRDVTDYLFDCEQKGVRFKVFCGHELSSIERMNFPVSKKEVIRIVPVVAGAGDGKAILTIGIGAALMIFAPPAGIAVFGTTVSAGTIASIGTGLVLSGVATLLAPSPPSVQTNERPENKASFIFQGPVNTILQGGCVPVCYGGPIEVGSYVISGAMDARDIPI